LEANEATFDGIFSSHFVEHIHPPQVMALIQKAWHALRPGGRLVLSTPNVRAIYAHLEAFYLHYDHVRFYHPTLLSFYFQRVGFVEVTVGENRELARPMMPDLQHLLDEWPTPLSLPTPPPTRNPLRQVWRGFRRRVLGPYPALVEQEQAYSLRVRDILRALVDRLDHAMECYVTGVVPLTGDQPNSVP
jgi:O-antigen chain-terminating methyltransferase